MRWTKATDFNFEDRQIYFGRRIFTDDLGEKIVKGSGRLTDGAFFWQGLNEPPVMERHFDELEILDESLPADDMPTAFHNEPVTFLLSNALRHLTQDQQRQLCNALLERLPVVASLEQEAERLYPYQMPQREIVLTFAEVTDYKRSAHITAARQYMGEIDKLKHVLHIDQTGLAAGLAEVNKIVEGYRWATEGRGPYVWNDDKYKEEMSNMLDNISEAATKALNSSGAIAHSVCCGKEGRTATMEGIGYVKQDFHDKEMEKLRAENEKMRKALEDIQAKINMLMKEDTKGRAIEVAIIMANSTREILSIATSALKTTTHG